MIRINLLGQTRPKTAGPGLPVETTIRWLLLLASVALAVIILAVVYFKEERQLDEVNQQISNLQAEKSRLQQVKAEVDQFEHQKAVLQQRINVIETLQKNRTGGQDLLAMVATTVVRTDTLWLTEVNRKGNALDLSGEAGSINAVANFLTQMRRSGYFDKIEIKEAKENDIQKGVQTYSFTMSAEVAAAPGAGDAKRSPHCRARPGYLDAHRHPGERKELTDGNSFPRMAAARSGTDVRRPGRVDRSFRAVFLAGTVGADAVRGRASEIKAVAERSDPVAGLPAAANRAAR